MQHDVRIADLHLCVQDLSIRANGTRKLFPSFSGL